MNGKVKRYLADICYLSGATAVAKWLNRGRKKVLTFHNVMPDNLARKLPANPVCISESYFRAIIRSLRRHYKFSTDVDDPKTLTITFDDGYCNQFEVAARVLQEEGDIPAILFAAGKALRSTGPREALAVDRLCYWHAFAPEEALRQLSPLADRERAWNECVFPAFSADVATRGESYFAKCDALYSFDKIASGFDPEYNRLRFSGIAEDRLDELRARGWTIGWHTETHFPLVSLSEAEILKELTPPEKMKGLPTSFPYGHETQVGETAVKVARELGYPIAYSNYMAACALTGRWFVPRLAQYESATISSLEFELSGMKNLLKNGRLLTKV